MFWRKWVVRSLVAMVLASCLGAGVVYQQWTNPTAVRQQVVEMLERQFPGATVTLDGARLRLLGGVVLSELRLLRKGENDATDVIHIPQANVELNKERFLEGKFAVRRLELLRPTIRIIRSKDGKWNVEGLASNSDATGPMPTFAIKKGTLIVEDNFLGPASWELHDLNMTLNQDSPGNLSFAGKGQSETFGALQVRGSWNRLSNAASVSFNIAGLAADRELVQYAAAHWSKLNGLQFEGKAHLEGEVAYDPGSVPELRHDVRCVLRQSRLEHPDLPVPLHNLSASLHCTDDKLVLEKLKAAAGTGKIECKGWAALKDPESTFSAELTAYHLPLTEELVNKLPAKVQPEKAKMLYDRFQPVGSGKFELFSEKREGKWVRNYCTLRPDNITVTFFKFKYPVDRLAGFVDYDFLKHASKFEAVGYSGTQPISLRGTWKGQALDTDALIEVAGHEVPIDNKLLTALPGDKNTGIQGLAGSFHATGKGNFSATIRRIPGSLEYQNTYNVHFIDCNAQWDVFPYPLEHVSGDLTVYPRGCYEFKNFQGTHNGGEVFVHGQKMPPMDNAPDGKLLVNISGRDICLDGDLRRALEVVEVQAAPRADAGPGGAGKSSKFAETWDVFSPAGRFNFQTQVEQVGSQPHDLDISVEVAGCAIEPSFFRYPLHDVAGQFRFHKNKVELANFTASHANSRISISKGTVDLLPRGGFYAEVDDLRAHMLANEEFLKALPQKLQASTKAINIKDQTFDVQTKLVVSKSGEPGKHPEIFWDAQFWFRDAALRAGIDLDHLTGTLACRGLHNGTQLEGLQGNLYIDETTIYKQPIRGGRVHFEVPKNTPDVMQFNLKAPFYGGEISGQGRLESGSFVRYEVDLTASQIQLDQFGRQHMGPSQQLAGIAGARLHLQGQGDGVASLEGNGSIDVPYSPMTRLLNLPLLLDLLKFLGLRLPDRTAFEEAHAVFAIHGNRVSISKLDLLGNAVSLYGKGDVNLDGTDLKIDMYPSWGRAEQLLPPAVRSVPLAINKQLLKIEMRGKLGGGEGDMQLNKRFVPGLMDPLLNFQNRMVGGWMTGGRQ